jgi:hypothetical protein
MCGSASRSQLPRYLCEESFFRKDELGMTRFVMPSCHTEYARSADSLIWRGLYMTIKLSDNLPGANEEG